MRFLFLKNIGLISAALPSWNLAKPILRGKNPPCTEPLPRLKPNILRANERRRTTNTIKLALQAAQDLFPDQPLEDDISAVFTSSEGDLDIVDSICSALAMPERPVSPTQFHNSVHNAPAGYWSIAAGCHGASISIGALEGSFASGLIEAATQTVVNSSPTVLISYDWPPPDAMRNSISIESPFAVAMLLSPDDKNALAEISLSTQPYGTLSALMDNSLEQLRMGSPAARSLPLLHSVACGIQQDIILPYLPKLHLSVGIKPCF